MVRAFSIGVSYFIFIGICKTLLKVMLYTSSISLSRPLLIEALVPTTLTPKRDESFSIFINMPFLFASSIKLTQTITLLVISSV